MLMQAMLLFTFLSTFLIVSREKVRRTIEGENCDSNEWREFLSVSQDTDLPLNYDVTSWLRQLHLQRCAFVEIGEGFCALFVEMHGASSISKTVDSSNVLELFFGFCSCATVRTWQLCSPELTELRKNECTFNEATAEANTSARVHRRLCDVTLLSANAPSCNCSLSIAGQQLYPTKGFPSCLRNPLPESLCSPRGVCGVARCTGVTIGGIHSVRCDADCHQRQPFCEEIGPWTSIPPSIDSSWSSWSSPVCNNSCGTGLLVVVSLCHHKVTGKAAIDCLGPGIFCCPENSRDDCSCEVRSVDGVVMAIRFTELCFSIEGCGITKRSRSLVKQEEEWRDDSDVDFDEVYYDDEETSEVPRIGRDAPLSTRRLLQISQGGYYSRKEDDPKGRSSSPNRRFAKYEASRAARIDNNDGNNDEDDDDNDDDEDDEEDENGIEADDSLAEEEEEDDEDDDEDGDESSYRGRPERAEGSDAWRFDRSFKSPIRNFVGASVRSPKKRDITDEDCDITDEDNAEALQYYDYDNGGVGVDLRYVFQMTALTVFLCLVN